MQWLVDIIREVISHDSGLVYREGAVGFDFTRPDFISDNTWRELNLFAIVPPYAVAVLVRLRIQSTTANARIRFRLRGDNSGFVICEARTQAPAWLACSDVVIFLDSFRFCEYRVPGVVWNSIDFTVTGWWLNRTVFH